MILAGAEMLIQAERVEVEALALERQVVGRDKRLAGLVRATCSETIASNLTAVLTKPFAVDDLAAKIRNLIET